MQGAFRKLEGDGDGDGDCDGDGDGDDGYLITKKSDDCPPLLCSCMMTMMMMMTMTMTMTTQQSIARILDLENSREF